MSNEKPETKLREGRVELSIWKNTFKGKDGDEHDSYMFSPNKLKQKEDGGIERTNYFTRSDLKNLNLLISNALSAGIVKLEASSEEISTETEQEDEEAPF